MDRSLEVCWSSDPDDPGWDAFVESSPAGHHEQTSLWGQVRAAYGWKVGRLMLTENGQVAAGAQVLVRRLGRYAHWAYVTYGPCLRQADPVVQGMVLTELGLLTKRLGAIFLVLGLPYESCFPADQLRRAGFERKPLNLPPHFLEATLVVDLALPPDILLSRMRPSTRRNIRQAEKQGVQVVLGNGRDLGTFHRLMLALCRRRQTSPNPAEAGFFTMLWDKFAPRGWVKVFLAMRQQEPVSAAVAFTFGDWFRVWKVGWSGEHAQLKPNEALWWQMMQYARQQGFRRFDFVSLNPGHARALAEGNTTRSAVDGASNFKLGFGGEVKLLPGAYLYFPNPLVRLAMRFGPAKRLISSLGSRLARAASRRLPSPRPNGRPGRRHGQGTPRRAWAAAEAEAVAGPHRNGVSH